MWIYFMNLPANLIIGLIGSIALLAFILTLVIRAIRREKALIAAFHAMAAENGLHFEARGRHNGRATELALRDDHGLSVEIARPRQTRSGNTTRRTAGSTTIALADPRFDGLAVYKTGAPEGIAEAAGALLGVFDNDLSRSVLSHFLGDAVGQHLGQLAEVPVPEGLDLTVMATADPSLRFVPATLAAFLGEAPWSTTPDKKALVLIGEDGLKLRLSHAVTAPQDVLRAIDALRGLAAMLR
jgi:hypothetical protein